MEHSDNMMIVTISLSVAKTKNNARKWLSY
nr:MAG TPA: hypothetical protein [Caudoviricetes sp.]